MIDNVDDIVNRQKAKEAKPWIDYEINNDNTEIIIKGGDLKQPPIKKNKNNHEKRPTYSLLKQE